ncbi:hypothetical protein MNBD_BACTEROID03-452 [hydrothermal vent metagenome]|uniref:Uncharacterized protein n=1 Tax=hydrothermal vent metagenome TaxID=652676 RepID=A0A3B0T1W2_9ZZZZ
MTIHSHSRNFGRFNTPTPASPDRQACVEIKKINSYQCLVSLPRGSLLLKLFAKTAKGLFSRTEIDSLHKLTSLKSNRYVERYSDEKKQESQT